MSSPRLEDVIAKLPTATFIDFFTALVDGNLEAAAKHGGGLRRSQLAALRPDGESGQVLDGWEKRAAFHLTRKGRLVILMALPQAAAALRGITEGPACQAEAEEGIDARTVPLFDPQLSIYEQDRRRRELMNARALAKVPHPKNLEQIRLAAVALVDLAQRFAVFDLATEFREPDRAETEKVELQRMAEEQGLGDLLAAHGEPERRLRSVK